MNANRLDAIANVQAQVEFVRRAQQIDLLEKEKALQEAVIHQQALFRNLIIFIAIAFSLLLFLLYGRFIQHRLNKKLANQVKERTLELEHKHKQLEQAYLEMEAISLTDKLTGINNRRFFEQYMGIDLLKCLRVYEDIRSGKRTDAQHADIALLLIDLDFFKDINDKYGHASGDLVIKEFVGRMKRVFRESDHLIRWGGEEFLGVARFINRKDAALLAQRMIDAVEEQPFTLGNDLKINKTCSVGFVCFPPNIDDPVHLSAQQLVSLADVCLYAAKNSGRNTWVGIESLQASGLGHGTVSPEMIEHWLKHDQIKVSSSKDSNDQIVWKPS